MAQNRFSPTNKDSLTVHRANLGEEATIKKSLMVRLRDLSRVSVVKYSLTTVGQLQIHGLGKVIAADVTGGLEA